MIHIVFQRNDVDVLKEAMELDMQLDGEIIQVMDDWAVGPIQDIYNSEGISARKQWWREVLSGGDYDGIVDDGSLADDHRMVSGLTERLREHSNEVVWIWAAQNKHDVSGYYWLISQLKEFQGRIYILYLNNLPFISLKGNIFYPVNLFDIPSREFLKAKKLARPVTIAEFELDSDEWQRLANERKAVRLLEGGKKLTQEDADFFDTALRTFITAEWQRASRIIHHYLSRATHITGDAYLLWRLKGIAATGEIDVQGEVRKMKDFEIKTKEMHPTADVVPS